MSFLAIYQVGQVGRGKDLNQISSLTHRPLPKAYSESTQSTGFLPVIIILFLFLFWSLEIFNPKKKETKTPATKFKEDIEEIVNEVMEKKSRKNEKSSKSTQP